MSAPRPRRCYEPGHKPKFLVVVDEADETDRALYFAARRAARVGAAVTLLATFSPGEFQHWFGVGEVAREEAEAESSARLARFAARARDMAGVEAEAVVRKGDRSEELRRLIDEDEDVALLVLAASAGGKGPGPLVSALAQESAGAFPVPIVVVPGALTDEEIDRLA
ncbi:universal stress protein [Chelatococcus sambhunathii]|uniref:Universal stress protein n=1 Tax=Chelatococcus sambhunathii TaxID=363953 RepID=A0ABU1DKK6_9HYPH|nr:universal stress protein [Chelatococcus sambhunathii]MDR4308548.1 universal stress protein [Chelatococcus sambhunathii]